jgi:hypothetical protein
MTRALTLSLLVLGAAAASGAGAATHLTSCRGSQLGGTFKAVPGSAGAGNIVYALVLRNVSTSQCDVSGLPQGRLLNQAGKPLPTHVRAAFPGALTAVLVRLAPGKSTRATARFSPDVPGPGEPVAGRNCEPKSYWFRVTGQGGGTTKVKLSPATPVCEHGSLSFSAYGTT